MFITLKDLERLGACEDGMRFIARFYPDGFEVEDLAGERHIPDDFLHWAKENLQCSEIALEKYNDRLGIKNSEFYYYSKNINNCKYVRYTKNAVDSCFIVESENVKNSKNIVSSKQISQSDEIYDSMIITSSNRVCKSVNVDNSKNIVDSKLVVNSANIAHSSNIFDSRDIIDSNNLTNCYFCDSCENLTNCMFCVGLSNEEFCLFNIKVGKQRFEYFLKQYELYAEEQTLQLCKFWPKKELVVVRRPRIEPVKSMYYRCLSKDFISWVKTLPNYEWQFLYKLTTLPEFMN